MNQSVTNVLKNAKVTDGMASQATKQATEGGQVVRETVVAQEIAAASSEQSTGVGQINTAMGQLNQITPQNASASEELAATAEEMSGPASRTSSNI